MPVQDAGGSKLFCVSVDSFDHCVGGLVVVEEWQPKVEAAWRAVFGNAQTLLHPVVALLRATVSTAVGSEIGPMPLCGLIAEYAVCVGHHCSRTCATAVITGSEAQCEAHETTPNV